MDNPQHYQPLSHALHPPQAQPQPSYVTPGIYQNKPISATATTSGNVRRVEEEEEEDDDDDEVVEEQLSRNDPDPQGSTSSSPQAKATGTTEARTSQQTAHDQVSQEPDRKRRPGRPRGSKNRKPRQPGSKQETTFYAQSQATLHTAPGTTPPQHPDVNAHNQQYYEFQWRVLNLCAEFYGAAEELVKGTPPLVIAQCYSMGPSSSVDPLVMLGDAKRICDTLLANPSQLISAPPPPIYPVMASMYKPVVTQPAPTASTSTHATTSTSKSATPSTVISNPQSFVVSLGAPQTGYPAQYPMYAPPGQYPTTPYYHQYAGYPHAATYYAAQPVVQQPHPAPTQPVAPPVHTQLHPQPHAQPPPQSQSQTITHSLPPPVPAPSAPAGSAQASASSSSAAALASNQGAWSDEETERLKKLAEDSRSAGASGEIEWDWVIHQWGNGRTRHQILIKATSLGLKESTSRSLKRRRENEGPGDAASPSVPPTPVLANTSHPIPSAAPSASPAQSAAASTPAASPALQHQQRPPPKSTPSSLPWPMPTVAVNAPSPVIAAATISQEQQRTSYYRPRPNQPDSAPKSASGTHVAATHQYMYQPNGNSASGSRLAKENGNK